MIRESIPSTEPGLGVLSLLESITDDAQGKGSSSGDLVFHDSISLASRALLGPLGLTLGSMALLGMKLELQPAHAGRCVCL